MKNLILQVMLMLLMLMGCNFKKEPKNLTESEKLEIRNAIRQNIDEGLKATINKDIDTYMSRLPEGLMIYDESGEIISREQQREYALRDWSIIDTTLNIQMDIDSIHYLTKDSLFVFTSQRWQRMMFQRDGITTDTVLTTQIHKETWKRTSKGWFGFDIVELGGQVFINGEKYIVD